MALTTLGGAADVGARVEARLERRPDVSGKVFHALLIGSLGLALLVLAVLLVDVDGEQIHDVRFPSVERAP